MMKKSGWLLVYFTLVGCTPEMQKSLEKFDLTDFVQVSSTKEVLLAHAFVGRGADKYAKSRLNNSMRDFTQHEENFAQQSLGSDKEGESVTWSNDLYGELAFYPGRRYQERGWQCRQFKVVYVVVGMGIREQKKEGKACLNPQNSKWEWAGLVTE